MKKTLFIFTIALTLLLTQKAQANDQLLKGLWMETANYPASSIIKFERKGNLIIGKYTQVSMPQKHWGFEVGETIIRGTIKNKTFTGEVLLKAHKVLKEKCPDLAAEWSPIELYLMQPDKIYGRWKQFHYEYENDPCEVTHYVWQLYGLEKINVK